MSSEPDPKSPEAKPPGGDDASIPEAVESEVATQLPAAAPTSSGSVEVLVTGPHPAVSGSIDVAFSGPLPRADPAAPVAPASELDSEPVSSGRVTQMTAAATAPTEVRSKRFSDAGKEMIGKGVESIGSGLESIGEGVSKLGEASKKVPLVGSSVAKLGEGISSVGESITDLPRAAGTRRGRLLVRSLIVGFILVFGWIAAIVILQTRRTDAPDFRPYAERILADLSKGKASIEELYEKASPRFQEMVRKDRFVDDMTDLDATVGKYIEVTAINESIVTRGPAGRIGRMSINVNYAKGKTRAAVSLHWDDGQWKLLGVSVEVPPELKITQAQREERVAACKDPMDAKRCEIHITANKVLEMLRDGHAGEVWDAASDVFQKQEQRSRFIQIEAEHQNVLGEYRRVIAVTEAKVIGGTRGSFDVLVEYSKANVRAIFGFMRASRTEPWQLRSLKVALPLPRIDDLVRAARGSGGAGSGSAIRPR
ncbi:MAG: DUF4019 domain-containing protein [Kofleriaceae bacterium]